jgi:hypothetical protein
MQRLSLFCGGPQPGSPGFASEGFGSGRTAKLLSAEAVAREYSNWFPSSIKNYTVGGKKLQCSQHIIELIWPRAKQLCGAIVIYRKKCRASDPARHFY